MNATGELVFIIGLTALAGAIIGWCLRSFSSRSAGKEVNRKTTAPGNLPRDRDDRDMPRADHDVRRIRQTLGDTERELADTKAALKRANSKDNQIESSNRAQVGVQ